MSRYYASGTDPEVLCVWSIERLLELAESLPEKLICIDQIAEFDENTWFSSGYDEPTCRWVALHSKRIYDADITLPLILSADGSVMDGMHRVAKAWLMNIPTISAKQFSENPAPDMILTCDEFRELCIRD